ncbi:MAG TPA: hypothetical protein VGC30_06790 [Dokdonella sp.]
MSGAATARTRVGESFEAGFIGAPSRRLFAVRRAGPAPAAAFVLCPPFFHEQFLSYRLLSLTAARLAARGIASLRFDYFGSGDSWGSEADFSLAGAIADTETALAELAARLPGVPLRLLGARAGAWPAATVAARHGLPLWLWQPLPDGAEWLRELDARDAAERASRLRYPFLGRQPRPAEPDRLLAAFCPPALREELAGVRLAEATRGAAGVVVVDAEHAPALPGAARTLRLPAAAAAWHEEITMQATFVTPAIAACIDALADDVDGAAA